MYLGGRCAGTDLQARDSPGAYSPSWGLLRSFAAPRHSVGRWRLGRPTCAGVVILSFGFRIFAQRDLMRRHSLEILGSTLASALFSLFATALAAHAIGLPPDLTRAVTPRSVTVALALPIAAQLDAPAPITAAAVVMTGLLGANFAQTLLTRFGFNDPIARGLATAGAAHGLGTAALSSKEPNALPFCALGRVPWEMPAI